MIDTPEWLLKLRRLRIQSGNPSYRSLAEATDMSASAIHGIFKGESQPFRANLVKIIGAFETDPAIVSEILDDYDGGHQRPGPAEKQPDQPSADAQLIAAAINNLADAIRAHGQPSPEA